MAEMIKRTKYLVAINFQLKYIGYILAFLYIGAALAGYTVYYTTWVTLGEKLANVYPAGRLVYIFHAANMTLLWRLLLITPAFILIGIILSHRIAGPIYRIGKYSESLMSGDYSRALILRKKDELKPIATKLTELCEKLRNDREERQKAADELMATLSKSNINPSIMSEIKEKVEKFKI